MFTGIKLTDVGAELLAAAQLGGVLRFTRIQVGSGALSAEQKENTVTALIEPVGYLPITEAKLNGNTISIIFQVMNRNFAQGFTFRELGLLAVGADGVEKLYAYSNAGDDVDMIPAPSEAIIDYIISLDMAISSDVENMSVEIDEDLTFITRGELANYRRTDEVIGIADGGTGLTSASEVLGFFMNSYMNFVDITEKDVLSLPPGIYHHESATSVENNYPISEIRALVEVVGQYRTGTVAEDGYPNGYWAVRVSYPYTGEQYWNHRTWGVWTGWRKSYNTSVKPTADDVDAVKKSGDTMTGELIVRANAYANTLTTNSTDSHRQFAHIYGGDDHVTLQNTDPGWNVPNKLILYKDRTVLIKALTIESGGTGATTAAKACENIGAVKKSGDTMSDNLEISKQSGDTKFVVTNYNGSIALAVNERRGIYDNGYKMWVLLSEPGTDVWIFNGTALGNVKKSGDTMTGELIVKANAYANILSTNSTDSAPQFARIYGGTDHVTLQNTNPDWGVPNKLSLYKDRTVLSKALTIESGGTGAATKKEARKNLGCEIQTGVATGVGTSGKQITFPTAFSGVPTVTANSCTSNTSIRITSTTATGCVLTSGTSNNDVIWQAIYISD